MDYIIKRAADRVTAFRTMQLADWWAELSPEGQSEYLKEHPDSKKAKEVHEQRKNAQLKRPSIQTHEHHLEKQEHPDMIRHQDDHPKNIEHLHPDAQKFFKDGHDKPGSPERKAAGKMIKSMSKQIGKSLVHAAKQNAKEWKHGVKGIGKLFAGKKLSEHEKEGVKAVVKDVLITAGIIAVGGGLAHGVLAAMGHMGRDLLAETFFKTVAHALIEHGSEVASVESPEAIAFAALVHEVIADSEAEAETAAGKFPPKKDKKDDKKEPAAKSKKPAAKGKGGSPTDSDEDDDVDEDESSSEPGDGDEDGGELDPEMADAVEKILDFLGKFAEEGKIPKEAWMAAANEEPMEDGKVFPDGDPGGGEDDEDEDEEAGDDEGVNEDEDEEDEGDGSTVEDKVKQKDPDEKPKKPKLKKPKSKSKDDSDSESEDDEDSADEEDDSE